MKVSGFTFVRNAIKFDYPIVEAISSILPLCDEIVVAVGNSEDDTLNLIKNIHPKVRIIETIWDDSLREGGRVLALETDKALRTISKNSDWAFYIQGDEVIHEKDLEAIQKAMEIYKNNPKIDGLLFNYFHFYGSYDYIGDAVSWYPNEIRIIKNNPSIYSYRDAQGFRKNSNQKLRVKAIKAHIYHYGWVRNPLKKSIQRQTERYWHDDEWMKKNIQTDTAFDYSQIDGLEKFENSHPAVMKTRILNQDWKFWYDVSKKRYSLKKRFQYFLKKTFGWRIGEYKNYVLV